ncbi:MAG: DUF4292 domain-containing protein [Calditrichaeota bacterium]|nr:MAG: DUF4292 domain-containing protein [Calditrichota bacterium]
MKPGLSRTWVPLLLLLLGCAGTVPRPSARLSFPDLAHWLEAYQANQRRLHSLRAKARLSVESMQQSGNLTVKVLWLEPEKAYLEATGPLGLDLGKVFVGAHRFIVYNQYENHFVAGNLSDRFLNRLFETDFTFSQLKRAVVGLPLIESSRLVLVDSKHGIFLAREGERKLRYQVNPATGLLEKWELIGPEGTIVRQEFKRYRQENGIVFPALVQLTHLQRRERISLFYQKIELNVPIDEQEMRIEVPPKVKQLNLE